MNTITMTIILSFILLKGVQRMEIAVVILYAFPSTFSSIDLNSALFRLQNKQFFIAIEDELGQPLNCVNRVLINN